MNTFHRILIATDFSPASEPAVRQGLALAKDTQSDVWITHAYAPPSAAQAEFVAPTEYDKWESNVRQEIDRKLAPILENAKKLGVIARPLVVAGNPADAIPEAAKSNAADLLVMGTHGRTGVSRMLLGSVASKVISTAPCPVLTVH